MQVYLGRGKYENTIGVHVKVADDILIAGFTTIIHHFITQTEKRFLATKFFIDGRMMLTDLKYVGSMNAISLFHAYLFFSNTAHVFWYRLEEGPAFLIHAEWDESIPQACWWNNLDRTCISPTDWVEWIYHAAKNISPRSRRSMQCYRHLEVIEELSHYNQTQGPWEVFHTNSDKCFRLTF